MPKRPTETWRQRIAKETADISAGLIPADANYCARLFPDSLLSRTDEVLDAFDAELAQLREPSDEVTLGAVRAVVLALNAVNDEHGGSGYETDERELLCAYIDGALTEAGVDVEAVAARQGIGRWEITDEWREW